MRLLLVIAAALAGAGCGEATYDLDGGDLVTVGGRFVAQRGCAECHQGTEAGAGTLAGQSAPRPGTMVYGANLTPDVATGLGAWADVEIVRAMRFGLGADQLPLCPPMPRFDGSDPARAAMTDLEARAIVAYLRSLPPVAHAVPESTCPPVKPPAPVDLAAPPPADLAAPTDGGMGD